MSAREAKGRAALRAEARSHHEPHFLLAMEQQPPVRILLTSAHLSIILRMSHLCCEVFVAAAVFLARTNYWETDLHSNLHNFDARFTGGTFGGAGRATRLCLTHPHFSVIAHSHRLGKWTALATSSARACWQPQGLWGLSKGCTLSSRMKGRRPRGRGQPERATTMAGQCSTMQHWRRLRLVSYTPHVAARVHLASPAGALPSAPRC